MSEIEISEKIDAPFYSASPAAWALAQDLTKKRKPYEAATLAVDLSRFRLPDAGSVQIVIDFSAQNATGVPPYEFSVRLAARNSAALFPHFDGVVQILDEAGTQSWLFLRGTYGVPMGPLGAALDRTLFHAIALHSLHSFLHWFANETVTRVARGDFLTAQQMMRQADG